MCLNPNRKPYLPSRLVVVVVVVVLLLLRPTACTLGCDSPSHQAHKDVWWVSPSTPRPPAPTCQASVLHSSRSSSGRHLGTLSSSTLLLPPWPPRMVSHRLFSLGVGGQIWQAREAHGEGA